METLLTLIANVVFQEELGAQSHDGEGQQEVLALFKDQKCQVVVYGLNIIRDTCIALGESQS